MMSVESKKEIIKEKVEECRIEKPCRSDPKFVGLDLSYVGTGLIVIDNNGIILEQKLVSTSSEFDTEERIIQIENTTF